MDLYQDDASTTKKGVVELATDGENAANVVVQGNDSRINAPFSNNSWQWLDGRHFAVHTDDAGILLDGVCTYFAGTIIGTGTLTSVVLDATNGVYGLFTTGAVSGDKKGYPIAGAAFTTGSMRIQRRYYPRIWMRFQLSQTATTRFFAGFHTDDAAPPSTFPTGDDSLNAKSGFGLYVTSGGAFRIGSNDGSGATAFTSSLAAADTNPHTIYLEADEAGGRWGYSFDNAAITYITTDTPASTTQLTTMYYMETASAAAKSFRLYNLRYAQRSNL